MKRKIKTGMIALGCCILVMTGVYGAFTDRLSVTSHIVTGDVHIGIQEFTRINKIEKNYTESWNYTAWNENIQDSQDHK